MICNKMCLCVHAEKSVRERSWYGGQAHKNIADDKSSAMYGKEGGRCVRAVMRGGVAGSQ